MSYRRRRRRQTRIRAHARAPRQSLSPLSAWTRVWLTAHNSENRQNPEKLRQAGGPEVLLLSLGTQASLRVVAGRLWILDVALQGHTLRQVQVLLALSRVH